MLVLWSLAPCVCGHGSIVPILASQGLQMIIKPDEYNWLSLSFSNSLCDGLAVWVSKLRET